MGGKDKKEREEFVGLEDCINILKREYAVNRVASKLIQQIRGFPICPVKRDFKCSVLVPGGRK